MPELPRDHERALLAVASVLAERATPFGVGGSAMLALMGIPVPVGDLDILVPIGTEPPELPWPVWVPDLASGPVSSDWIVRTEVHGVPVDLISGLRVDTGTAIVDIPIGGGATVTLSEQQIVLSAPEPWIALYRRHKPGRADMLVERLGM